MVKKILIYIAGVITGVILIVLLAGIKSANNGITLFEQEGACVSENSFEVFQVLETGDALAEERGVGMLTVLFLNDGQVSYYDHQIIKVPYGKCVKQIGIFKYTTNSGMERTVPIVDIRYK